MAPLMLGTCFDDTEERFGVCVSSHILLRVSHFSAGLLLRRVCVEYPSYVLPAQTKSTGCGAVGFVTKYFDDKDTTGSDFWSVCETNFQVELSTS